MGTATMAASSARWCAREGNRGGNGVQGERGEVQGARASPWRREGVGEAATAKQEVAGALRARATPRLASAYWQRKKRTRGGEEVGWASELGQLGCQVSQVQYSLSLSLSLSLLFSVSYLLCNFRALLKIPKQSQNS